MYLRNTGDIFDVTFNGDRRFAAVASAGGIRVFALATGGALGAGMQTQEEPKSVALSSNRHYLAAPGLPKHRKSDRSTSRKMKNRKKTRYDFSAAC